MTEDSDLCEQSLREKSHVGQVEGTSTRYPKIVDSKPSHEPKNCSIRKMYALALNCERKHREEMS